MATDSSRRLHHFTPSWVKSGAIFHVRARILPENPAGPLTHPTIASPLLKSAMHYHDTGTWHCHLMLLMPDHWHALISFPVESKMTVVVGRWKAWQTRHLGITWQDNFFDHRIRNARGLQLKAAYIRQNPVVKGLCQNAADWPWVIDPMQSESADTA